MKFTMKAILPGESELIRRKGLDQNGRVQRFHTNNVNRRIGKYMPHLSGALETKLKHIRSDTEIEVLGPYAKYQFYCKVMVGKAPKKVTDKPLEYTDDFNPKAGPFWDRALSAAEGDAMREDLQRYINRKR